MAEERRQPFVEMCLSRGARDGQWQYDQGANQATGDAVAPGSRRVKPWQ